MQRIFLEKASEQLGIYQPEITRWDAALKFIARQIKGKPVIIIDEVPYLIVGSNAVMSSFQSAWDLHLKDANVMVILLGSSIGMMENEVLGYRSPFYGRRTGQIKVEPLKFTHVTDTFYYLLVKNHIEHRVHREKRQRSVLSVYSVVNDL